MSGKKFRFSLDSVLQLRRHETERAEQALVRAMAACRAQEEVVERVQAELAEAWRRTPAAGSLGPTALRRHAEHRRQLQETVRTAEQRLAALHTERKAARERLLERQRAEEGLQRLHDREHDRHRRDEAHADAAFLDEQAVMRHWRQEETRL